MCKIIALARTHPASRAGQIKASSNLAKAYALAEERDRAVNNSEKSKSLRAEQESELAAERVKVAELIRQIE
jgi:hypothetical protein